MKNISCPCCGSTYCKEVSEEKWLCLACDNTFLIHNLSKEFHITDEHISDVHSDLKQNLSDVKNIISNSIINRDEQAAKMLLEDAKTALLRNDISSAYRLFQDYSYRYPDSCIGYYGMFDALCIETDYYKPIMPNDGSLAGYDLIVKAIACEDNDVTKLAGILVQYKEGLISNLLSERKDEINKLEFDCLIHSSVTDWNNRYYKYYGECPICYKNYDIEFMNYQDYGKVFNLTLRYEGIDGLEKYRKLLSILIQHDEVRLTNESKILNDKNNTDIQTGFFGKTMAKFSRMGTERNINILNRNKENKTELYNIIDSLIKDIQAINSMDSDSLISSLKDNINNIKFTSDQLFDAHEQLKEKKRLNDADRAEGFFSLYIANWGHNSRYVFDYISDYVDNPSSMKPYYKNNSPLTIPGYRKSVAHKLQEELMSRGATVYVNKM